MIAAEIQGALGALSERTTLERAVVGVLQGLHIQSGGYLAEVAPYAGELSAAEPAELYEALAGRTPAVLVSTGDSGIEATSMSGRAFSETIDLELYVVSNSLRSLGARTQGDVVSAASAQADPGIYRILRDCFGLLAGRDLAIGGMGLLFPRRTERLFVTREMSAYQMSFSARFSLSPPARATAAARPITSLETQHNLDGGAAANPVMTVETQNG